MPYKATWLITPMSNTNFTASSAQTAVNLSPNQVYTVQSADTAVTGAVGSLVVLPDTARNVVLSGPIGTMDLTKSIFNYYFMPNGLGGAYVFSSTGALLATIGKITGNLHVVFGDQSALTLNTNAVGGVQIHYDQVQLSPNYTATAPNSNITILGAKGNETITIPLGVNQVSIDANVENVVLSNFNYDPSLLKSNGSTLSIFDTQGNSVLNWASSATSSETLSFNNAIGTVSLNTQGLAQFNIKGLLLNAGQNYTLSQSGVTIYGNVGNETVTLVAGDHNESIDSHVEKVVLPVQASSYSWTIQSGNISLYDASHTLVATIGVERTVSGTNLTFSDQTLNVQISSGGISVFNAAGQVVQSGSLGSSTSSTPTTSKPSSTTPSSSSGTAVSPSNPSSPSSSNTTNSSSASAHFDYTLDWSSFSAYAGSVVASIQSCLTQALNNIASHFSAKGNLDVKVVPEITTKSVLAEASGALVAMPSSLLSSAHGATLTTDFLAESQTGIDANGSQPDATVYINMADLSLFDLNPLVAPTSTQYDLTTILTHEMLHALGFDGLIGSSASQSTAYDRYVVMQNGTPYFTGPDAQSVYGGPVPLAPVSTGAGSAYYHVAVSSDLMNNTIGPAQVKTISKLDLAILQDLGAPVLVGIAA